MKTRPAIFSCLLLSLAFTGATSAEEGASSNEALRNPWVTGENVAKAISDCILPEDGENSSGSSKGIFHKVWFESGVKVSVEPRAELLNDHDPSAHISVGGYGSEQLAGRAPDSTVDQERNQSSGHTTEFYIPDIYLMGVQPGYWHILVDPQEVSVDCVLSELAP